MTDSSWKHFQKIENPDKNKSDNFGVSVDMHENFILVGANNATGKSKQTGAVYLFELKANKWQLFQKLFAPDGLADDNFGQSVSMIDDTIVVGAYTHGSDNSGACYIFKKDKSGKFAHSQKLVSSATSKTNNYFGRSVSVYANQLVIGSWGDSTHANKSGCVYFLNRKNSSAQFESTEKFFHPEKQKDAYYGFSVATYGTLTLVGSHGDGKSGQQSGAVFVFKKDAGNWKHFETLYPDRERNANGQFGYQVKVKNNRIMVSAFRDDNDIEDGGSGYLYIYENNEIQKVSNIVPDQLQKADTFGSGISIDDDYAIIGAKGDNGQDITNLPKAFNCWDMINHKSGVLLYPTIGSAQLNLQGTGYFEDDEQRGRVFQFPANPKGANRSNIWSPDIWDEHFATGTFTWSFWMKPRSLNATTRPTTSTGCVFSKWYTANKSGGDNTFIIYASGIFYSSYSYHTYAKDWKPELDVWTHMTYVLDKGQCKIYADGVELTTVSQANSAVGYPDHKEHRFKNSKQRIRIGAIGNRGNYQFNGYIDEIKFFTRALTNDEIYVNYRASWSEGNIGAAHIVSIPRSVPLSIEDPTPTPTATKTPTPTPTPTVADDECMITIYYEIFLKTGENTAKLVSEVHEAIKLKKSSVKQKLTRKLIKLNYPKILEGDPKIHFVKSIKVIAGEKLKNEVKKDGTSIPVYDKTIENESCQQQGVECEVTYSFDLPPVLNNCELGDFPPTPTPTETPTPTPEFSEEYSSYMLTDKPYDVLSVGVNLFKSTVKKDHSGGNTSLVYIEDLIENPSLITEIGPNTLNNAGILCRHPEKLARSLGGHNTEYYYKSSLNRPFYLQLNTNGYRHTYAGTHPFAKHNLYIKSWPGSRKYLINKQGSNLATVENISVQYSSTAPAEYSAEGYKNKKPYWVGKYNNESAYVWWEDGYWTWNVAFTGKDRERCRKKSSGKDLPFEVSPLVHDPIPVGWKNNGISVIITETGPKGPSSANPNIEARWYANSMSIPNTSEVGSSFRKLVHYDGNVLFDKQPHVKNIKIHDAGANSKYIRGVELQQNIAPKETGPPYLFIDGKLSNQIANFSISFFYKPMEENLVQVKDNNLMKYAQGVFGYNQQKSKFFRMFTLANKPSDRYFDNVVATNGTSLFIDGGSFNSPQMLVSKLDSTDVYHVTMKYKKPSKESNIVSGSNTDSKYETTENVYNLVALGEKKFVDDLTSSYSKHSVSVVYLEDLIENPSIIDSFGAKNLNNIGMLVRQPQNLSKIGGTTLTHYYNQSSSLKRPYYLQLGTSGLTHTYKGSHPFKKYNLYIKSWMGARKYFIKKQSEERKTNYIRTQKAYNFGSNPSSVEQTVVRENVSKGYKTRIMTLEDLLDNTHLIESLGADFFNNVQIKIEFPSKLQNANKNYTSWAVGSRTWYLQKNTNGARWGYGGTHPLQKFNLYIKSWPGSRPTILVNEPDGLGDDPKGTFSIRMQSVLKKTGVITKEHTHNFNVDWNAISNLSVGGGSNCVIADFRVYNKLLEDGEIETLINNNEFFNGLGPTFP
jgi:hypothetical protein